MKPLKFLLFGLLLLGLGAVAGPARADDLSISIGLPPTDEISPPPASAAPGPPPHAPAHGLRRQYRYYPDARVYFDPGRLLWFYTDGHNWQFGASLPLAIRAQLGSHVSLELATREPWRYNPEHVKKYPPGQWKKAHGHGGKHGKSEPPGQAKKPQ
ncbi:MAG: hypothetical protein KQJ78_07460 [Deltaproteobacteria bacterium]|nr:hypothetical protein [Deltaproteobacteria bacterium]